MKKAILAIAMVIAMASASSRVSTYKAWHGEEVATVVVSGSGGVLHIYSNSHVTLTTTGYYIGKETKGFECRSSTGRRYRSSASITNTRTPGKITYNFHGNDARVIMEIINNATQIDFRVLDYTGNPYYSNFNCSNRLKRQINEII